MPVYWRESLKGRWAVVVYSDPYTMEQFERVMSEIFAHPISRPELRLLVDRRYCSAPMSDFIQRMVACADKHRVQLAGSRAAAVVSTDAMYGMGRMLESLVEAKSLPGEVRTFRDWDEAEQWLLEVPARQRA